MDFIAKANQIRKEVVDVSVRNGAGHIASSLSSIEILVVLYYKIMNLSDSPEWEERDRLIFSKAHGCYGLYAIIADKGYIERSFRTVSNFISVKCLTPTTFLLHPVHLKLHLSVKKRVQLMGMFRCVLKMFSSFLMGNKKMFFPYLLK